MISPKLVLAVCAVAGLIFSVRLNLVLHNEKESLKTALGESINREAQLQESIRRQAEVLSARDEAITKLNADKTYLNRKLREAAANDAAVKSWSDTPIPVAVDRLLREGAAAGGADTEHTPSTLP